MAGRRATSACAKRTAGSSGAARHRISTPGSAVSVHRVNETPDNADTEDRWSESGACSSGEAEGPHRRARTSAGTRNSSGRRASTPCRGQVTEHVGNVQGASARCVDDAPEAKDTKDISVVGGVDPTRTSAGTCGSSKRRARTLPADESRRASTTCGRVALTRRRRPRTSRTAASWAEPTHEDKRRHTRLKRAPRKDPCRERVTARVNNVWGVSRGRDAGGRGRRGQRRRGQS